MIRHLRHEEIDRSHWDSSLLRCQNRSWYAQSWVLDVAAPGWEALMDDATGAVMPLTWRKRFGVEYLFQPFGLQQLGVFSAGAIDPVYGDRFMQAIPKRFRFIDICLNAGMQVIGQQINRTVHELDMSPDYAALRERYANGHRRNLKRALPDDVNFVNDIPAADMVLWYSRYTAAKHSGSERMNAAVLESLITGALLRKQGGVTGLVRAGHLIAAVCFLQWEGRSILFKSANSPEGAAMNAMFHLVDRHLAANAGTPVILDFAGSEHPGTARFNEGFGAQRVRYVRLLINRLPGFIRWLKPRTDGG